MKKLTFVIPVQIDSEERVKNLAYILEYLDSEFKESPKLVIDASKSAQGIIVANKFNSKNINSIHHNLEDDFFHKTKLINEAVKQINTKYFCMWDADVLFTFFQIEFSMEMLESKGAQFVYPYNGLFFDVLNFDYIFPFEYKNYQIKCLHENSTGGAFLMEKEMFLKIGGMNENMVSWGFEDDELLERVRKLGLKIDRTCGECFHLSHRRTFNSSSNNPKYMDNMKEYQKICEMDKKQIIEYFDLQDF